MVASCMILCESATSIIMIILHQNQLLPIHFFSHVYTDLFCLDEQHTLVCSTDHLFLVWNVRKTSQPSLDEMRSVSSSGQNPVILPIRVILTNFEISRDSPQMTLPLVSTMTIENVNSNLEGTVITCTGQNSSSSSVVLMTTVHIFDVSRGGYI